MCCFTIVWCVLWYSGMVMVQKCALQQDSTFKLSIISRRNETGNWIAQVSLDHGAGEHNTGPYEVNVDHSTTKCSNQKSVLLVTTIAGPSHLYSPENYELLPNLGYYRFHDVPLPWHQAATKCMKENGHLLILNSVNEFEELKKKWDESGVKGDFLHVGINDFDKEGDFVTIIGEPLKSTGYVKWAQNEPNSGNTANCGAVKRTGDLYDSYCSNQFPFFCEGVLS